MIKDTLKMPLDDLKRGYSLIDEAYECMICQKRFELGEIFTINDRMFVAEKAVKEHIKEEHGGILNHLLEMDKKYTGLTDKQKKLMLDLASGLTDKEIANKNGIAQATVRHQKFMFREKARQAKMFLAIFDAVEEGNHSPDQLIPAHVGAKMVDERYVLTVDENEKILSNYFEASKDLKLKVFPSKEKKKIAVLRKITEVFEPGKKYTEIEINQVLKDIYDDIATIRRYLIQYGFLDRTKDGKAYWLKI